MEKLKQNILEKYSKKGRLTHRINDDKYLCNEYTLPEEIIDLTIKEILEWCWKNNTIPMKDILPELKNSNLRLESLDGGWVNVLKLQVFIKNGK